MSQYDWPITLAKQQKDVTWVTSGMLSYQIRLITSKLQNSKFNVMPHLIP